MCEKDGQTGLLKHESSRFKRFQSILGLLGIQFGTRHNTKYGISDMAGMLITMAKHRSCANSAHEHSLPGIRTPSGSWALKGLRCIDHHDMAGACDAMIRRSALTGRIALERRNGRCRNITVAIDKHKIPHYDKEPDMSTMVFSKHEHGTFTI